MSKILNCSSRVMMLIMVLIFWCAAAVLMFMGIQMFLVIGSFQGAIESKFLLVPAVVLILLSLLCLVIGIIGCAGASVQSRKTQGVFFVLLLLIVVIEFTGFILCIVFKEQLQSSIKSSLKKDLMDEYGQNVAYTKSIDTVQIELHCCGVDNYTDWRNSSWANSSSSHEGFLPGSCCNTTGCNTSIPVAVSSKKHYNVQGCSPIVTGEIRTWLVWLIVLAVIFLLVELLAMTCTCIRMKNSKRVKYQTLSEENALGYKA